MAMPQAGWIPVPLPHDASGDTVVLEVQVRGGGEPVVLIQTALTADEFLPLAARPELADSYQVVAYHRRGYSGSSPVHGAGSIERDARDCLHLLDALGLKRAHAFGASYSAAVALQLAAMAPERIHTLTIVEPPPVLTSKAQEFAAANAVLLEDRVRQGPAVALDHFMTRIVGPSWRTDIERILPGGAEQIERDAGTFLDTDLPALFTWRFGPQDAARITPPVLYVGGTESGPWFAEVKELMALWLPHARIVMLDSADHSLALTHAPQLAAVVVTFLQEHPMAQPSGS